MTNTVKSVSQSPFISFPPGLLTADPIRLPILAETADWMVLQKPSGIIAIRRGFGREKEFSINDALLQEWDRGKPQLQQIGLQGIYSVCAPDCDTEGLYLLAKNADACSNLRRRMGDRKFCFTYRFWSTRVENEPTSITCDLPLARHRREDRALVSHRTGKKTSTFFKPLASLPGAVLWESSSPYDRWHQVRLHAAECGIPVTGDHLYGAPNEPPPVFRKLLPKALKPPGPMMYQSALLLDGEMTIESPAPGLWRKLLSAARKSSPCH